MIKKEYVEVQLDEHDIKRAITEKIRREGLEAGPFSVPNLSLKVNCTKRKLSSGLPNKTPQNIMDAFYGLLRALKEQPDILEKSSLEELSPIIQAMFKDHGIDVFPKNNEFGATLS
jgi:hypothetical protein